MSHRNSGLPNSGPPSDDVVYEGSPLQFTADRMGKLVRIAERDPKKQVLVDLGTMNKLYMAFLGVLEVYQEQTQAGVVINGERYLCSQDLQAALAPLIDQARKTQAEIDVDRAIEEAMSLQSSSSTSTETSSRLRP